VYQYYEIYANRDGNQCGNHDGNRDANLGSGAINGYGQLHVMGTTLKCLCWWFQFALYTEDVRLQSVQLQNIGCPNTVNFLGTMMGTSVGTSVGTVMGTSRVN